MTQGLIRKALSGFYYVFDGTAHYTCRARGVLRHQHAHPLVGDRVLLTTNADQTGTLQEILPRKNEFFRPAVANIDQLVIVASQATPITVPFLIDRITVIAAVQRCECIICINKNDLSAGDQLAEIYERAGFQTLRVSAKTGQGIAQLRACLTGKISAFTGNSGVGKSSILNAIDPNLLLPTGEVSEKLGRGKHTTRHIELIALPQGGAVADTPGFSSFDVERLEGLEPWQLPACFPEFVPLLGQCRFQDCAHTSEPDCAILNALQQGKIAQSRHESYLRLYEQLKNIPTWEQKKNK